MKTLTRNMFAETNEDLPIVSGMGRTDLDVSPMAGAVRFNDDPWDRDLLLHKIVEAESVADFLDRYLKPDRYHGRDEANFPYSKYVLQSHEETFARIGHTSLSRHESVTGAGVYYWPERTL